PRVACSGAGSTAIYTLSLHDALPISKTHPGSEVLLPRQKSFTLIRDKITVRDLLDQITILDDEYQWKNYGTESTPVVVIQPRSEDRKSTRLNSSHLVISYAVFCLKKK